MLIEDIYWNAVLNNEERFNGIFYLCVKTTGIFCRPTCRARTPLRKNVEFVKTREEALDRGFRACKRCKPEELSRLTDQEEAAVSMFHRLVSTPEISLNSLSEKTGLSYSHSQKVFKSAFGLTPKQLADYIKTESFKERLSEGQSILDAAFESGFGSSSRVYERNKKRMGMTPAEYGKNGLGASINYSILECSLGKLLVAATAKGVCSVKIGDSPKELIEELKSEFSRAEINQDDHLLAHFGSMIVSLAEGKPVKEEIPVDVRATSFQALVWTELQRIPFGETITYGELANRIGDPKAVRAVATACAKNNVALVVPCHRVVGKDGKMRGYRWGTERKEKLLEKENPNTNPVQKLFR